MNCAIPNLIQVNFLGCLSRVSVASTSNYIGTFIKSLDHFCEHETSKFSDFDPTSAWDKLEQDLTLELECALERVL